MEILDQMRILHTTPYILRKLSRFSIFFNYNFSEKTRAVICSNMGFIDRKRDNYIYENNYIRLSSLELIAHEIAEKNLEGCVAELGVYRADFAQYINIAFSDRKLYLFDTFEGFDERDVKIDVDKGYSNAQKARFSETSIELVINKMKYPKNCIIKKGYFPETAKGIEEKFVFVSIDVDLFEPIYEGLRYFYPRLQQGGYIFVHDYNNARLYGGTKVAVKKFSTEYDIPYFPLTDSLGSAVFIK
jgi:O-methyltransferase